MALVGGHGSSAYVLKQVDKLANAYATSEVNKLLLDENEFYVVASDGLARGGSQVNAGEEIQK